MYINLIISHPAHPCLPTSGNVGIATESDIFFDRIVSIKVLPPQHVYDLMIENAHNFIANDIIAHNTYINGGLNATGGLNVSGGAYIGGSVGIGTTSPSSKLHVIGNTNVSQNLTVEGQCVTGDTLLSMVDGAVKKIIDVKAGDFVLSLNEETQKIEPHRIKGLLDMGIKPVFNLTTEDGRSIRTTGNHPYLTKEGWVKVAELSKSTEIAVPINKVDYFTPNNFLRSSVETTLTLPCCLCLFSSDHNSNSLEDKAKAKYGASLACSGNNSMASGRNLEYFDSGIISIFLNNRFIANSSSGLVSPEYFNNLSSRFLISSNTKAGECILTPALDNFFINVNMNPLLINDWNTIFASTTNIILECQKCPAFLSMLQNLRFSTTQDAPCFLATADFISSASLNACSFVNLLFDTILSAKENSTSSMNSFTTLFKAASKSFFNSGEISTLNCNSAILSSPNSNNENDYLNVMKNNNPSCCQTGNIGIGSGIKWVKIKSIEYAGEEQVYDIEVEGTHNFIANGIVAHNTYISGNVGIGTTSPETNLAFEPAVYSSSVEGIKFQNSDNDIDVIIQPIKISGDGINLFLGANEYVSTGGTYTRFNTTKTSSSINIRSNNGNIEFKTNLTDRVFISNNGNVGIGTTSPDKSLHVTGDARIGGTLYTYPSGESNWLSYNEWRAHTGSVMTMRNDGTGGLALMNVANTALFVNGTTGNVGIGTTGPAQKLDVVGGNIRLDNGQQLVFGHATNNGITGNDSVDTLIFGTAAQDRMTIKGGNVGIGTTAPTQRLTVAGNAELQAANSGVLILNATDAGANSALWYIRGIDSIGDNDFVIQAVNDARSSGSYALQAVRSGSGITSVNFPNGNVGIGTTNPTRELHVIGDANITGDLRYGTAGANSPIFFKSDGPEPICMKAENNVYVGCIPKVKNNKYEWACGETVECNRKMVLVQERDKLKEKIKGQELEEKLDKLNQRIKEKTELREMLDEVRLFEQEEGIGGELISIPEQLNATIEINQTAANLTIPIAPAPIVNTSNQTAAAIGNTVAGNLTIMSSTTDPLYIKFGFGGYIKDNGTYLILGHNQE